MIEQYEVIRAIEYPESDGQRMADNTRQFEWIMTIKGGLDALLLERTDVFVAGDLLWYPVRGRPDLRRAPDAMVAFGRPKGHRGSYLQWREGNIAPQVVFEVLSPGNSDSEMAAKLEFYDIYGVEEYYLYDPDDGALFGWQRRGIRLWPIMPIEGWVSPRLGVRFELEAGELGLYTPTGTRFLSYVELVAQRDQAQLRADEADAQAALERTRAEEERIRADEAAAQVVLERTRAEEECARADEAAAQAVLERARADKERIRAEEADAQVALERARAAHLAAQLRALGIDPDAV